MTHYSEYFRAALNGSFKEAEENLVTLSDVSISTFDVFVDWLYTQKLPEQGKYSTLDEAVGHWPRLYSNETRNKTEGLIDLYIFADGHDIPKLRREVMNVLFTHLNSEDTKLPYYETVVNAFPRLPERSPVRQLLIDCYCRFFEKSYDDDAGAAKLDSRSKLPTDFLVGIMLRHADIMELLRNDEIELTYRLDICDYHEHASEAEREKCKEECKVIAKWLNKTP